MKLSLKQVVASVAGATIAALALSFLGVGGTIMGVAVGSAAATIVSALAFHSLERGHAKVREIVAPQAGAPAPGVPPSPEPIAAAPIAPPVADPVSSPWSTGGPAISTPPPVVTPVGGGGRRWPTLAVILLVFALTLGLLTGLELALGRPISSALTGSTPPAAKTSVGDVIRRGATTTSTTTRPTTTTSHPTTTTTRPTTTTSTTHPSTTSSTTTSSTTSTTSSTTTTSQP